VCVCVRVCDVMCATYADVNTLVIKPY